MALKEGEVFEQIRRISEGGAGPRPADREEGNNASRISAGARSGYGVLAPHGENGYEALVGEGEEGIDESQVRPSARSVPGVLNHHGENGYEASAAAAGAGPGAGVLTPHGENGYEASAAGAGPGAEVLSPPPAVPPPSDS